MLRRILPPLLLLAGCGSSRDLTVPDAGAPAVDDAAVVGLDAQASEAAALDSAIDGAPADRPVMPGDVSSAADLAADASADTTVPVDAAAAMPDSAAQVDVPPASDLPSPPDAAMDRAFEASLSPCGEMEPNDTRQQATPIAAPVQLMACLGNAQDIDFYELTAPDDPAGGYYQIVVVTPTYDFSSLVRAYTVSDNGELGAAYASTEGQDLRMYLAAAPGQKYRLAVSAFAQVSRPPAPYTLEVSYTKVQDTLEPNNTRETARPVTLGAPVTAYLFEGPRNTPVLVDQVADWYSVSAGAGSLTATIDDVPTNLTAWLEIFDSTGKSAYGYSPNDGARATVTITGAPAGTYRIVVRPFTVSGSNFFDRVPAPDIVPDNYTRPYKLTISQ